MEKRIRMAEKRKFKKKKEVIPKKLPGSKTTTP